MSRRITTLLLCAAASLTACRGESTPKASDSTAAAVPAPATESAPGVFRVRFETSRGPFVIEAHRDWAPLGVDRFYQLVKSGFYDNARFFRVLPGFVAQFGISGDPAITKHWEPLKLMDDPVKESNKRGFITYAKCGAPNCRSTQLFINLADNVNLDADGFAPIGFVTEGMAVIDGLFAGYGESASDNQARINAEGNAYLEREFPKLDFVRTARVDESPVTDSATKSGAKKK
jgi:peptidyl-prolyl cis-trans isomerase A (cyclophilin A)